MTEKLITTLLQLVFRALELLAPPLAGRLAIWLFFRPLSRPRPQREERALKSARIDQQPFSGHYPRPPSEAYYTTYEWGEGEPILLVHGWGGRATQFCGLLHTLIGAGYRVVTFDAPAHGDSPGTRTNLLEFGQIIHELSARHGRFHGIVAHSLGSVASARAITAGVATESFVSLGAPSSIDYILSSFAEQVRATERSMKYLKAHLQGLAQNDIEEFSLSAHAPNLGVDTLLLHDRKDRTIAFSQGESLARSTPKAKFIASDGLGHNRILSDPKIIEEIVAFLA